MQTIVDIRNSNNSEEELKKILTRYETELMLLINPDTRISWHNATFYNKYHAPTCMQDGTIEYWFCYSCNKCFSDLDCTISIDVKDTVLLATEHHYQSNASYKDFIEVRKNGETLPTEFYTLG